MNDHETANKLLVLALHDQTPEHERTAAALGLCRVIRRMGILDVKAPPLKQSPRTGADSAQSPVRVSVVTSVPDVEMGPSRLGHLGWSWVRTGSPRFCIQCRKPRKRGSNFIAAGTVAAERKGEYSHEECHREWGG